MHVWGGRPPRSRRPRSTRGPSGSGATTGCFQRIRQMLAELMRALISRRNAGGSSLTSDHGEALATTASRPTRQSHASAEHRVPLIAAPACRRAGERPVSLVDLAPTLIRLPATCRPGCGDGRCRSVRCCARTGAARSGRSTRDGQGPLGRLGARSVVAGGLS
jgi:hypothetical protein